MAGTGIRVKLMRLAQAGQFLIEAGHVVGGGVGVVGAEVKQQGTVQFTCEGKG